MPSCSSELGDTPCRGRVALQQHRLDVVERAQRSRLERDRLLDLEVAQDAAIRDAAAVLDRHERRERAHLAGAAALLARRERRGAERVEALRERGDERRRPRAPRPARAAVVSGARSRAIAVSGAAPTWERYDGASTLPEPLRQRRLLRCADGEPAGERGRDRAERVAQPGLVGVEQIGAQRRRRLAGDVRALRRAGRSRASRRRPGRLSFVGGRNSRTSSQRAAGARRRARWRRARAGSRRLRAPSRPALSATASVASRHRPPRCSARAASATSRRARSAGAAASGAAQVGAVLALRPERRWPRPPAASRGSAPAPRCPNRSRTCVAACPGVLAACADETPDGEQREREQGGATHALSPARP